MWLVQSSSPLEKITFVCLGRGKREVGLPRRLRSAANTRHGVTISMSASFPPFRYWYGKHGRVCNGRL